jgi:hypothetical protein
MSAFIGGRGRHGDRANRFELARTDRLRLLHEIQQQITQIAATRRLKISDRHIRRLLLRLEEYGDRAVDPRIARTAIEPQIAVIDDAKFYARWPTI